MASHSSTLAWRIPWKEEPGRLQTMGSWRVWHNWETSLSLFTFMIVEGNGNPLQCSCLENPRDRGAWRATVYGIAQSRTRLKWLSSSRRIAHWLCIFYLVNIEFLILIILKAQHSENEDHGIWSHHFLANRWVNSVRLYFWGLQNHCRWWLQPWNLKTLTLWKKNYDQPR